MQLEILFCVCGHLHKSINSSWSTFLISEKSYLIYAFRRSTCTYDDSPQNQENNQKIKIAWCCKITPVTSKK